MGKRRRRRNQKSKTRRQLTIITLPKRGGKRPKGITPLTRCTSKKQAVYGYAITYSPSYQKAHDTIVNVHGMERMPEYRAERLFLQRAYGITPRKTKPQRL